MCVEQQWEYLRVFVQLNQGPRQEIKLNLKLQIKKVEEKINLLTSATDSGSLNSI